MSPSKAVKRGPEPTAAQWRVINAALKLFAQNGVGGTSLRMIATELGVTVAAVYHQYHTKDEIIRAAVESELRRLEAVVDAAEAVPTAIGAREALVAGMVDLTSGGVGRRVSAVLSDPIVTGSFDHARFRDLIPRMRRLLMGDETSPEPRIRTATLIAVLNGAATHPFVADFDEDTLRRELLQVAHLLLPPLSEPGVAPPVAHDAIGLASRSIEQAGYSLRRPLRDAQPPTPFAPRRSRPTIERSAQTRR